MAQQNKDTNELIKVRRQKLADLQAAGKNPFEIMKYDVTHHSKEIKDISGLTHGIGWCAPQQGACKLTLNVKEGIIEEALIETVGCSGMTHSAAMASEILPGKTLLH